LFKKRQEKRLDYKNESFLKIYSFLAKKVYFLLNTLNALNALNTLNVFAHLLFWIRAQLRHCLSTIFTLLCFDLLGVKIVGKYT